MTTLISADSHFDVSHDTVKTFLASRFHGEYDRALGEHRGRLEMHGGRGRANLGEHWYRDGHVDPTRHLDDMDIDGVAAEVVYCEVSGFRYLYLLREGAVEATRAFNDTMHAYASVDPSRLIVSYQIPLHDIDIAISEVERVAAMGGKSLQIPVFPTEVGQPDYYHDRYRPLWAAVEATGLPLCCHTGMNAAYDGLKPRDPTPQGAISVPLMALSAAEAMMMWIFGGVLARHPRLKVVFVEPGLGWVAWFVQYIDHMVTRQKYDFPAIRELPSHYFRRNMFVTFMEDADGVQLLRHRIGIENILWASDYPHPPTTWPRSQAAVAEQFAGVPEAERDLMVAANARRVWNL